MCISIPFWTYNFSLELVSGKQTPERDLEARVWTNSTLAASHLSCGHGSCGMGAVLGIPGTHAQLHGQPESGHGAVMLLL